MLKRFNNFVKLVEVGPRDGLQSIGTHVPTKTKIKYIDKLSEALLPEIEITGFVHPDWVPQFADSSEITKKINYNNSITYTALVPNLKGAERALKHGLNSISVITAVSETFNKRNTNCTITESLERISNIIEFSKNNNIRIRAYISTCWDCPYEGFIKPENVKFLLDQLYRFDFIHEFVLSDTIGKAKTSHVQSLLDMLFTEYNSTDFALHFHDTFGNAVENLKCGLNNGIRTFDSSTGGIGGCPYAPGAKGNISTQKAVDIIEGEGFITGINREKLNDTGLFINSALGQLK